MKKAIFIFCAAFAVSLFAEEVKLHILKSFPMNLNVSADTYEGNFVYAVGLFIKNCSCPEGDEVRNKYKLKRYSTIDHLSKKQLIEKYPDIIKFIQEEFDVGLPTLEKEMLIQKTVQIKMLDSSKREIPAYRCLWHAMVLAERGSVTAQLALLYQKGSYLSPAQRRNITKELFDAGYMEAYVAMGRYYELRKNKEKVQEYFEKANPVEEPVEEVARVERPKQKIKRFEYYTAEQKELVYDCYENWIKTLEQAYKLINNGKDGVLYLKLMSTSIEASRLPHLPESAQAIFRDQMECSLRWLSLAQDKKNGSRVSEKELIWALRTYSSSFDSLKRFCENL